MVKGKITFDELFWQILAPDDKNISFGDTSFQKGRRHVFLLNKESSGLFEKKIK